MIYAGNDLRFSLVLCGLILPSLLFGSTSYSQSPPPFVTQLLNEHCIDCHGAASPEGGIILESLETVGPKSSRTWQVIRSQLASGQMPPPDETKPDLHKREKVIAWIEHQYDKHQIPYEKSGGDLPVHGNLIDHDRLFSDLNLESGWSPPRFWRRSQPQYDSLMEQLWVIPKLRYEKAHRRSDPAWAGYSYSQPFPQLDPDSFTNYSGSVHADEAILKALLDAGNQMAIRLTSDSPPYSQKLQPPIAVGVPSIRRGSSWEKFKKSPPQRPAAFESFLTGDSQPTDQHLEQAIQATFTILLGRSATAEELARYKPFLKTSIRKTDAKSGLKGLITAVFVSPEFVFRMEIGMTSKDSFGRRFLSAHELAYAIGYGLSDQGPDPKLWAAVRAGKLNSKQDVEREVRRILADDQIEKNSRLRFFQEFFGYYRAIDVFKDKAGWEHEIQYAIRDADLLVEYALERDQDVLGFLLTTDKYFVAYPNIRDKELFAAIIQKTIDETVKGMEKQKQRGRKIQPAKNGMYSRAWAHANGRALIPRTVHNDRGSAEMSYIRIYGIDGNNFEWTPNQPISVPGKRAGLLTHPAWLVAHSTNFDNDIVRRGKWIRERLLAGNVPEVPIDVEAMVPDEPEHSLRHRMRVTREERCWKCHRLMDPLGLPFEQYDHYGLYREKEIVGARKKTKLDIDASGAILFSGEPSLNQKVVNAEELVQKLAASKRVRQSFVRHAFRFWMGRNEMMSDSTALRNADQAYAESKGSFTELLVSLFTSDPFLYRR